MKYVQGYFPVLLASGTSDMGQCTVHALNESDGFLRSCVTRESHAVARHSSPHVWRERGIIDSWLIGLAFMLALFFSAQPIASV